MTPLRRSTLNLYEFKEYLKDKRVIVVGNNVTALEKVQGDLIDSYDVVIRFGKGLPDGKEKYIGSVTDVWVTGIFRKNMRNMVSPSTIVLYNNNVYSPDMQVLPTYEYLSMYSYDEIKEIAKEYIDPEEKLISGEPRLSAGATTAHWLVNVVGGYESITFINFDFFQQAVMYYDRKQDTKNVASSWHIPIAVIKYVDLEHPEIHPAHSSKAEKALFSKILQAPNAYFIGDTINAPSIIEADNIPWDNTRLKL